MVARARKVPGDLTHDPKNEPAVEPKTTPGSFAKEHLFAFVERVERLSEEIVALGDDRKEVYDEAKANGFDVKILREVIRRRGADKADLQEHDALLDLYERAVQDAAKAAYEKSVAEGE